MDHLKPNEETNKADYANFCTAMSTSELDFFRRPQPRLAKRHPGFACWRCSRIALC